VQEEVTTDELLAAWRDATRAAEFAARLVATAEKAAERAAQDAGAAEEVATMAQVAAEAATAADGRQQRWGSPALASRAEVPQHHGATLGMSVRRLL